MSWRPAEVGTPTRKRKRDKALACCRPAARGSAMGNARFGLLFQAFLQKGQHGRPFRAQFRFLIAGECVVLVTETLANSPVAYGIVARFGKAHAVPSPRSAYTHADAHGDWHFKGIPCL